MILFLKKPVSLPARIGVLYAFTVVGIVGGEIEKERAGIWAGFVPEAMIFLTVITSPAIIISSLIQMSRRLLIAFGLYHLMSVLLLSVAIAHSEGSTASVGYFALILFGIPISTICYLVWLKFSKQVKDNLGDIICKFYTQTSLPLFFIIAIFISFIWIVYEVFGTYIHD